MRVETKPRNRTCRKDLTDDQRQEAWNRYAALGSWVKVADELHMGVTTLREKLGVTPQTRYSSRCLPPNVVRSNGSRRREEALYDPHRDPEPVYDSALNAARFGDPPRGRRELLEANAERTAPPTQRYNSKYWHL